MFPNFSKELADYNFVTTDRLFSQNNKNRTHILIKLSYKCIFCKTDDDTCNPNHHPNKQYAFSSYFMYYVLIVICKRFQPVPSCFPMSSNKPSRSLNEISGLHFQPFNHLSVCHIKAQTSCLISRHYLVEARYSQNALLLWVYYYIYPLGTFVAKYVPYLKLFLSPMCSCPQPINLYQSSYIWYG